MGLQLLRINNFRNISTLRLDVDGRDVFLVGENGQGKTNFLEAVHMLCFGSSFRTRNNRDMITHGIAEAVLWGRMIAEGEERGVGIAIDRSSSKQIAINGKRIKDRVRLIEFLPAIAFTHEDLRFIDGEPDRRRSLLDQTLSLFDPPFIKVLRRYRQALRERNALLRTGDGTDADVYDTVLASTGVEIQQRRASLCQQFSSVFTDLCLKIGGISEAYMEYKPSWKDITNSEEAQIKLSGNRARDIALRTTTSGPHRDDVVFSIATARFTSHASTGQKRLASLVVRVAQAEFFLQVTGRKPILLLDDVLLELDATKREEFVRHLPAYDQAFFTFLPDEPYQRYSDEQTMFLEVKGGTFNHVPSWRLTKRGSGPSGYRPEGTRDEDLSSVG